MFFFLHMYEKSFVVFTAHYRSTFVSMCCMLCYVCMFVYTVCVFVVYIIEGIDLEFITVCESLQFDECVLDEQIERASKNWLWLWERTVGGSITLLDINRCTRKHFTRIYSTVHKHKDTYEKRIQSIRKLCGQMFRTIGNCSLI